MKTTSKRTGFDQGHLVLPLLAVLFTVPAAIAVAPILIASSLAARIAFAALAPLTGGLTYLFLTGLLSRPFHHAIKPGKFPRDTKHKVYGPRRLYGLLWGAAFYSGPLYFAAMSHPRLRTALLRLFGYRGAASVNIAPDAWIRDLPVLHASESVYVANKATIGTNMCLSNGAILVDSVTLGKKAMVGHLSMVAPGSEFGECAEVGVGSGIGIRAKIGAHVRIGPTTTINHGAVLGDRCDVGTMSYVGIKVVVAPGISLPPGANIPDGAEITTQSDVENYISSETQSLVAERKRLEELFNQPRGNDAPPVTHAPIVSIREAVGD